jgi:hypothetical protein
MRPCRHRLLGDGVHDDSASAEELTALRAAVLRCHDEFVGTPPGSRSVRVLDGLQRLHLSWLVIPWIVVNAGWMFLSGLRHGFPVDDEQAVLLYRRLSGKDPHVARAEVLRIALQLASLDERAPGPVGNERPGAPRGADPGELEAAAGALLGYHLAGRQTDDELLDEVQIAWAEYEELTEQLRSPAMERGMRGVRRADPATGSRLQAAADHYRAAWRRWLDRQAERGSAAGPEAR